MSPSELFEIITKAKSKGINKIAFSPRVVSLESLRSMMNYGLVTLRPYGKNFIAVLDLTDQSGNTEEDILFEPI